MFGILERASAIVSLRLRFAIFDFWLILSNCFSSGFICLAFPPADFNSSMVSVRTLTVFSIFLNSRSAFSTSGNLISLSPSFSKSTLNPLIRLFDSSMVSANFPLSISRTPVMPRFFEISFSIPENLSVFAAFSETRPIAAASCPAAETALLVSLVKSDMDFAASCIGSPLICLPISKTGMSFKWL